MTELDRLVNLLTAVPLARLDPDLRRHVQEYERKTRRHMSVFELPNGRWEGEAVMIYQANRPDHVPVWRTRHPGARLIMRVHKGDLVRIEEGGGERIMVVHRLDAAADRFKLAEHTQTGNLDKRHADPEDPFRWLMASYNTLRGLNALPVRVDELGTPWRIAAE